MASDSGNVSEVTDLKTPESLKAPIWHHFGFRKQKETDALDKNKAICKSCQMEVKYCGNTTNLRNHLLRHHPDFMSKPSTGPQQMKLKEALQLPASSARSLKITETKVDRSETEVKLPMMKDVQEGQTCHFLHLVLHRTIDSLHAEFIKLHINQAAQKAVGELDTVLEWLEGHMIRQKLSNINTVTPKCQKLMNF